MQQTRMDRVSRVARGAWFAAFATMFAAVSHLLAGGNTPAPVALVATMVAVLPLCVALAGRELSLWRVTLAVALSQGLFHWSFGSIGFAASSATSSSGATSSSPVSAHAEHWGLVSTFVPSFDSTAAGAGWLMLLTHAVAAACTIVMLRFGEVALRRMRETVRTASGRFAARTPILLARPRAGRAAAAVPAPLRPLAIALGSLSHRGPPTQPGWAW